MSYRLITHKKKIIHKKKKIKNREMKKSWNDRDRTIEI